MERLKVQLAALMESQRKAAGYAEGPGGRSNALACVPCLRRCFGWGGCPRKNCGSINVVLGQLRQAETPPRSAAGYELLDQGRAAIAVLSGLGRLTVHLAAILGCARGGWSCAVTGDRVGEDAYRALQHPPGSTPDPPRRDRAFLPADRPLAVTHCFRRRPTVVAGPAAGLHGLHSRRRKALALSRGAHRRLPARILDSPPTTTATDSGSRLTAISSGQTGRRLTQLVRPAQDRHHAQRPAGGPHQLHRLADGRRPRAGRAGRRAASRSALSPHDGWRGLLSQHTSTSHLLADLARDRGVGGERDWRLEVASVVRVPLVPHGLADATWAAPEVQVPALTHRSRL